MSEEITELDLDWDDFQDQVEECEECGRLANHDVCKEHEPQLRDLEQRTKEADGS